jgi:hypothetical protein
MKIHKFCQRKLEKIKFSEKTLRIYKAFDSQTGFNWMFNSLETVL